jgi:hypothetical protein
VQKLEIHKAADAGSTGPLRPIDVSRSRWSQRLSGVKKKYTNDRVTVEFIASADSGKERPTWNQKL